MPEQMINLLWHEYCFITDKANMGNFLLNFNSKSKAFSLVEVMIAVTILSLGVLPMMSVLLSSRRTVQAVGFHMMASELAANKLDRILALPYQESFAVAKDLESRGIVDALPEMQELIDQMPSKIELQGIYKDLQLSFKNLSYNINTYEKTNHYLVSVTVFFETTPGKQQDMTFEALKFRESGR